MAGRLDGKTAVIFGGAQGIGRAAVAAFVREGARVFVADLKPLTPGSEPDGAVEGRELDASDPASVQEFIDYVYGVAGRVDVLVNNAGTTLSKPLASTTVEEYDRVFDVNVKAAFLASRLVLPRMIEAGGGSIIFTSSNGGLMGRPADPVYNASKHAIVGLTKSIAVAHAHQGVRANAVCPGAVDTPMLRGLIPDGQDYEGMLTAFAASTPAARVAHADEVASAMVFLASDEAPSVNGVALAVDGAKAAGTLPGDRYRTDFAVNAHHDGANS